MAGFLIGEEGPLSGLTLRFETGEEWALGRDPDEVDNVLEDPMVSRKHVVIKLTPEGYVLENLSSVNPATQNGKVIAESVLLREGDIIQIGSTFFRFSEIEPETEQSNEEFLSPILEDLSDLATVQYDPSTLSRWLLKVISGPNTGAEFGVRRDSSYTLGKDPNVCDIVFQDISVSRQHARITSDGEENVFIEDLGSRNGVLVNGELIQEKKQLTSEDIVSIGTTAFLMIDREAVRETVVSVPSLPVKEEPAAEALKIEEAPEVKDWREISISKRVLSWAAGGAAFVLAIVVVMLSLFKSEPIVVIEKNEAKQVTAALHKFPDVQFTLNAPTGHLLIVGHVLTSIDKRELLYILNTLPFINRIDDNIVVDELVWQNMNALLSVNPAWSGVSFTSPTPGHFVMRGYVITADQWVELTDYINMNFPYVDRLENQVVVENNLMMQVESILITRGFNGVTFQLKDGELLLAGRVPAIMESDFKHTVEHFQTIHGIRQVKNFIIYTNADTSRIDLSGSYHVTGYSKKDDKSFFVVINGRIIAPGDTLDGMTITDVQPKEVFLEKDGLKFKINYNQQ
jgi:type III secretion system YscD/HrpQ family protein